jgi:hypothetical protein
MQSSLSQSYIHSPGGATTRSGLLTPCVLVVFSSTIPVVTTIVEVRPYLNANFIGSSRNGRTTPRIAVLYCRVRF